MSEETEKRVKRISAAEAFTINARQLRANALAANIIQELDPFLSTEHGARSMAFSALCDLLAQNGAAFTTDEERALMGLEARDQMGWTPSERIARKQRELEAMSMLARVAVQPKP